MRRSLVSLSRLWRRTLGSHRVLCPATQLWTIRSAKAIAPRNLPPRFATPYFAALRVFSRVSADRLQRLRSRIRIQRRVLLRCHLRLRIHRRAYVLPLPLLPRGAAHVPSRRTRVRMLVCWSSEAAILEGVSLWLRNYSRADVWMRRRYLRSYFPGSLASPSLSPFPHNLDPLTLAPCLDRAYLSAVL
ncbi:hypothetical protein BD414DRAFT_481878 [Trametes punicea]|nr:hypothetical protein BD414DRAFT_481878 [Trametes punicea]